jgi:predicted nucleic acid-binding protein
MESSLRIGVRGVLDPASGPFLFDTSAESWFARQKEAPAQDWWMRYLQSHPVHISAVTVFERVRGYALLARDASQFSKRQDVERARLDYLADLGVVWPVDQGVASISAEICALLRQPPTPPKRAHQFVESRQERLARWRADVMIAATALAADMLLIHNNAADFEAIRGSIEQDPVRFPGLGPLRLIRCASVA